MEMPVVTVILGAGASRDVSYARGGEGCLGGDLGPKMPSPLDSDFFDLLQQLEAQTKDAVAKSAMERIISDVLNWRGEPIWTSMEKMFYSLHVSKVLEHKLFLPDGSDDPARRLVNDFLLSIRALLSEAHGTRVCTKHCMLLQRLCLSTDAVITFNYDFVPERVFAQYHGSAPFNDKPKPFGDWFYGLGARPNDAPNDVPTLYKLHGSLNWDMKEDGCGNTQSIKKDWPETWDKFSDQLDYSLKEGGGYQPDRPNMRPPVLFPYWDKRVEKGVWLKLWKGAAEQLQRTDRLIIWGYSLPPTDLKARELIRLALKPGTNLRKAKVAVIDPSSETQGRWRSMLLGQQFWRFRNFEEFSDHDFLEHLHAP